MNPPAGPLNSVGTEKSGILDKRPYAEGRTMHLNNVLRVEPCTSTTRTHVSSVQRQHHDHVPSTEELDHECSYDNVT